MSEMEFKSIEGFPEYRIYQDGHVYSCRSKKVLKPNITRNGYKQVSLCQNGGQYIKRIHRLVAEHFIDNPENKPQVDHIDRNKTNNMYWNLRWVTPSENKENTKVRIDSKFGEKYIGFDKSNNRFRVIIKKYNLQKRFKTLDEAVEFRNAYCGMNDLVY